MEERHMSMETHYDTDLTDKQWQIWMTLPLGFDDRSPTVPWIAALSWLL